MRTTEQLEAAWRSKDFFLSVAEMADLLNLALAQRHRLQAEVDRLTLELEQQRVALSTPEGYRGQVADVVADELERLKAELARLEADLPKLADGVAVVPRSETELWHPDYTNCQCQDRDSWWQADDDGSWMVMLADEEGDNGRSAPIWECYLTEAAMLAANENRDVDGGKPGR